ncbi:ferrous iron transport protein A [Halorhabdus sp. CBA1104]|uniref:FeoA family protein n=1 Tax=unclassified Halorhabdus TaxID=2621901 RepID=UPI0012B21567|nr:MULTISPECIES: FeoA family protein [unclassified Halorhabdus]QGN07726.1 ferrous iron transport protein A [Halorhabdus sp. CBA1104]
MAEVLGDVDSGEFVRLADVPDGDTRARLLRLGFLDGTVECRHHIRKGPVIVRRNGTELALGADLADSIEIERPRPEASD